MTNRILGIRAGPKAFHWAVVEGTQEAPSLLAQGKAEAPASYEEPAAIAALRDRVLHLIDTYHPTAVGVRFAESFGGGAGNTDSARRRCRVEGVVLEASHSRGLGVLTGALSRIGAKLGTRTPKKYIEGGDLRGLDLSALPSPRREAVLVAVAQLPRSTAD